VNVVALVASALLAAGANCDRTSTGLVPLTELGTATYHGFRGGLYPGGRNAPSARYLAKGLAAAKKVKPIGGKIVLLSIGMSNTTQEFSVFKRLADADPRKRASVVIVDGAQGGQDAIRIGTASAPFWSVVDQRLQQARVSAAQVQVVWMKQAYAGPRETFPADARRLQGALRSIHRILAARFPNLRLVYLSSRIYAGYASTSLNPEPYAYQSGFAVKWTVQDRIEGKLTGPWVGWGPYLWADGLRARKDGLTWSCDALAPDGTHPSESGRRKVADQLLRFFTTSPTARTWFAIR
jgi:hypothetical protein